MAFSHTGDEPWTESKSIICLHASRRIRRIEMLANRYPRSFYLNLAQRLMIALSIPQGNSLVMVFGTGQEHSNLEAIANWIASLESEVDLESAAQRIESLASSARDHIEGAIL